MAVVAGRGSDVKICGGQFRLVSVFPDGVVNVAGGDFSTSLFFVAASAGSNFNIEGSDFAIDGQPLSLEQDVPTAVLERDVVLTGVLADGSPFSFGLESSIPFFEDFFDVDANLTVTLVEPIKVGDVNGDLEVNLLDVTPFVGSILGDFEEAADINKDGVVDLRDVPFFIDIIVNN